MILDIAAYFFILNFYMFYACEIILVFNIMEGNWYRRFCELVSAGVNLKAKVLYVATWYWDKCVYILFTLTFLLQSRAALSLLAYCYFYMQDFVNAANCYEHLTIIFPDIEDYRLYYAQALYQVRDSNETL